MKRYAILNEKEEVISAPHEEFRAAVEAARAMPAACYVREIDEEASEEEGEWYVSFGNCHAFAIE